MYPNAPLRDPLKVGEKYQDIIKRVVFERWQYVIEYYTATKDQYKIGESKQGFEIKLDTQLRKYGHLSIEIAEKTRKDLPDWTPSGIFRKDNTVWYVQGDYKTAWFFKKSDLVKYYNENTPKTFESYGTVRKFYLNIEMADKLAKRKIEL